MRKLDVMDAEQLEKYEAALAAAKNAKKPEGTTASNVIRLQCQTVKDFFVNIFGEEILQEEEDLKGWNYRKHFDLMDAFIEETTKNFAEENKKFMEAASKYTQNRAERRR